MKNVFIKADGGYITVTAPADKRGEVADRLLGIADNPGDVHTITGVEYGLGFRMDGRYRDAAHEALVVADADPVDDGDTVADDVADDTGEPPRGGKGSGRDTWAAFLTEHGIAFTDDDDRDALIALWDSRVDDDNNDG